MKSVILFSGGIDSIVAYKYLQQQKMRDFIFLTIDYGQKNRVELSRAKNLIRKHSPKSLSFIEKISLNFLNKSFSLMAGTSRKNANYHIPVRNLIFLSIAMSVAEAHSADEIVIGSNLSDLRQRKLQTFGSDSSRFFYDYFEACANNGSKKHSKVRLTSPLVKMPKFEVIRLGAELGVDYSKTWTCYEGTKVSCGRCKSCESRLLNFMWAGLRDPIPYLGGYSNALERAIQKQRPSSF